VARVALMCGAAYATHILLDWLGVDNSAPYGIQALWPFSGGWYLSHLDIFGPIERRGFFSVPALRQNTITAVQEIAILGPLVWGVWLIRVKALAGLAAQLSRGDHPTE
jgi:inner membrane protein